MVAKKKIRYNPKKNTKKLKSINLKSKKIKNETENINFNDEKEKIFEVKIEDKNQESFSEKKNIENLENIESLNEAENIKSTQNEIPKKINQNEMSNDIKKSDLKKKISQNKISNKITQKNNILKIPDNSNKLNKIIPIIKNQLKILLKKYKKESFHSQILTKIFSSAFEFHIQFLKFYNSEMLIIYLNSIFCLYFEFKISNFCKENNLKVQILKNACLEMKDFIDVEYQIGLFTIRDPEKFKKIKFE